ncbi:hypothetical protein IMF22_29090 [Pseudomonas poae]|uniref:Guanylate cyclase domain-containing protein n=1 Tax=Pseudomonas poae TaxID=200451 RepID=A0A7M1KK07_9PSED|nr:hypothetical protein [Pseudomonas poae]QOQ75469.1 hypothetical protein IMF22_29090 [Pseudomonas poae]
MKIHFVAFLDILGFKALVDEEVRSGSGEYLEKLLRCHQKCAEIFKSDPNLNIIQFSDSIVISRPYDASHFIPFITSIAEYQRYLLDEQLLCRGGVAVNQHFTNGTFTFSAGLIDAYNVESKSARYPRVVIAPDVIDLIYPSSPPSVEIMKEDDGLYFIDYIGVTKDERPRLLKRAIRNIVNSLKFSDTPSIREKGIWLANYSDAILRTNHTPPKFEGGRIQID